MKRRIKQLLPGARREEFFLRPLQIYQFSVRKKAKPDMRKDVRASNPNGPVCYLKTALLRFSSHVFIVVCVAPTRMENECELGRNRNRNKVRKMRIQVQKARSSIRNRNMQLIKYENEKNASIPLPILAAPKVHFSWAEAPGWTTEVTHRII